MILLIKNEEAERKLIELKENLVMTGSVLLNKQVLAKEPK